MKNLALFVLMLVAISCNNQAAHNDVASPASRSQSATPVASNDRSFIQAAVEASRTELALGRFASGHATDQRLKDYGYLMMNEHTRLLKDLEKMAMQRNVPLPDTVNGSHLQLLQSLGPKAGNFFDSAYMAQEIAHQKVMVNAYDKTADASADTMLATYAKETTPLMMRHLLRMIDIKDSINIRKP